MVKNDEKSDGQLSSHLSVSDSPSFYSLIKGNTLQKKLQVAFCFNKQRSFEPFNFMFGSCLRLLAAVLVLDFCCTENPVCKMNEAVSASSSLLL